MRAFWAKEAERSDVVLGDEGFCGGLAASEEAGAGAVEKGLESGFVDEDVGDEKGLLLACEEGPLGFEPNNMDPTSCFSGAGSSCAGCSAALDGLEDSALSLATLTPLKALTLPSFRRQAFLLHAHRYSLLSWPGNRSGRSPLSCNKSAMYSLQLLHCAKAADGVDDSSIQVGVPPRWLIASSVVSLVA